MQVEHDFKLYSKENLEGISVTDTEDKLQGKIDTQIEKYKFESTDDGYIFIHFLLKIGIKISAKFRPDVFSRSNYIAQSIEHRSLVSIRPLVSNRLVSHKSKFSGGRRNHNRKIIGRFIFNTGRYG